MIPIIILMWVHLTLGVLSLSTLESLSQRYVIHPQEKMLQKGTLRVHRRTLPSSRVLCRPKWFSVWELSHFTPLIERFHGGFLLLSPVHLSKVIKLSP